MFQIVSAGGDVLAKGFASQALAELALLEGRNGGGFNSARWVFATVEQVGA